MCIRDRSFSPTMLLMNMYQNPKAQGAEMLNIDESLLQQHFEEFYEDVHGELSEFGLIEEMHVVDNIGDHMVGNVYVMFDDEEGCARALTALNGRFYAGRPIMAEFSPVTDFHEARCRQYDEAVCNRGGHCNFMHIKPLSRALRKKLNCNRSGGKAEERDRAGGRSRSPARGGHHGRDRDDRRDERRDSRRDRGDEDRRRDSRRDHDDNCLLYTSPSPRDRTRSRMPSSA
eukprot:TRINITY_DN6791_c0_g1_i1.p1 TRINITY_DN6791_c0_g1~~TRINITY_DN6791_c0_g1_i1.p1  ORF type:complete len:230 (-),score=89.35 TRINITY_DN6791_c0_g1_i1:51-740(-)